MSARSKRTRSPSKLDPSRTASLRRAMSLDIRRRFAAVRHDVVVLVAQHDAFALNAVQVRNAESYAALTDAGKTEAFKKWLEKKLKLEVAGRDAHDVWRKYAEAGYRKGVIRAYLDAKKLEPGKSADFYAGGRDQFLRDSFLSPVAIERVQYLSSRTYMDLEGLTDHAAARLTHILADGLVSGDNPRDIADELSDALDVSSSRGETIARTEIIRAHAEGQLDGMKALGVRRVGVAVEWLATDDDRVCPECASMEGTEQDIDEAHGQIPLHPNCRCCWVPAVED